MKNAIATVRLSLDIPENKVKSFAGQRGLDASDEHDHQAILEALEEDIGDDLNSYMEYAKMDYDVDVDG